MVKKAKLKREVSDPTQVKVDAFFTFSHKQQRAMLTVIFESQRNMQKMLSVLPDAD
jgi:hypothetical protein